MQIILDIPENLYQPLVNLAQKQGQSPQQTNALAHELLSQLPALIGEEFTQSPLEPAPLCEKHGCEMVRDQTTYG